MRKQIGSFELNGEIVGDLRITTRDKLMLERTAKVRKWDLEEQIFSTTAFMVWAAATRMQVTDLGFDAFCEAVTDVQIDSPEDSEGEVTEEGLTQPSEV